MSNSIRLKSSGNFSKTLNYLKRARKQDIMSLLNRYGQIGVDALSAATPKRTGLTAASWSYEVSLREASKGYDVEISWHNSNKTKDGIPIVILLRYGHGTGNGGYVAGYDFISPAIQPIFDQISESVWTEVTRD